jgi:hypothetical protein
MGSSYYEAFYSRTGEEGLREREIGRKGDWERNAFVKYQEST